MACVEEYRQYAAELIRIAQQTRNSNDKATLLDMAQRWRELAEKLETDEREGTEEGNLLTEFREGQTVDDLTPEQQAVAATVGAIQRIAMAIVDLPKGDRAAHYTMIRRNFEAALTECGVEGATAHTWLDKTMIGIESLVSEIEAGGGAVGGKA